MTQQLRNPPPPRLPEPSTVYSRSFMDSFLQVLRLYFNQLFNVVNNLLGPRGGTFLQTAYALYTSSQTQTAASATTAYPITFNNVQVQSGVTQTSPSEFRADASGEYQLILSLQWANSSANLYTTGAWVRVNGVNVATSRAKFSVTEKHGTYNGHVMSEQTVLLSLTQGDVVQAVWWSQNPAAFLEALPAEASPDRPTVPSARLALTFVSATPAP